VLWCVSMKMMECIYIREGDGVRASLKVIARCEGGSAWLVLGCV